MAASHKMPKSGPGSPLPMEKLPVQSGSMEDSSDSEGEVEASKQFTRRVSTSKQLKNKPCIKEGYLHKQTNSFQRWRQRYFKLRGRKLYYAKDEKSPIFDEVDLNEFSVAERSIKNFNNSFTIITPFRTLVLFADHRKEMEEWISALKSVHSREYYEPTSDHVDAISGMHNWYACSHARPTYCNVCREALSGVTSHGLSCEVCKFKAHKRCAVRALANCKWSTLATVGIEVIEDEDGISMPHQWLEGNLPVSAKCIVCDKTCGSVLRLQDWRCLWCKVMVHTQCRSQYVTKCPLGQCRVSLIPPTALHCVDSDGYWVAEKASCKSPLLVFVNSKSGDNQGVRFLRRFKQLLNPAQVFDLMNGGPHLGLRLFQKFETFRVIIAGGDGSVGWVLAEMDKMDIHRKCQIGVLPLGTGNDLARVLGWGTVIDDDAQLPAIIEKLERARTTMLDRWSIMVREHPEPYNYESTESTEDIKHPDFSSTAEVEAAISNYEDSVAEHLAKILQSDKHSVVISSAKVLCKTVKNFVAQVGAGYCENSSDTTEAETMKQKCAVLNEKLESLLKTLNEESNATPIPAGMPVSQYVKEMESPKEANHKEEKEIDEIEEEDESAAVSQDKDTVPEVPTRIFKPRDALMLRANSLKKAVRQIIEQTEKAVDEQNAHTQEQGTLATVEEGIPSTSKDLPVIMAPEIEVTMTMDEAEEEEEAKPSISESEQIEVDRLSVGGGGSGGGEAAAAAEARGTKTPGSRSPLMALRKHFSGYSSSAKAKSEKKKLEKELLKLSPDSFKMRRICHGSTLVPPSNVGTGPIGLSSRISSMENISALPGISGGLAGLAGGNLISKVLLANADALCAPASPLMDQDMSDVEGYDERYVMNNYFGIGLDAKIALDFHNKREEHPEKCRSRKKAKTWYGIFAGKELVQRTSKNLHERIQLECDGQRIPLPTLQGIVVLNIPSYMGGFNFWGGRKEDSNFAAPSFDDKILEVVAVYGVTHMAMSRLISVQHHRIAQCRVLKLTILGDEGLPIQVDGEAWIQPPGFIKIVHKNRAQMLIRDRAFETTLKIWADKQKVEKGKSVQLQPITDEEANILTPFSEASAALIRSVKIATISHSTVEQELSPFASSASNSLDVLFPGGKIAEGANRKNVIDFINSIRTLHQETAVFLNTKSYNLDVSLREELDEKLTAALQNVDTELRKVVNIEGVSYDDEAEQKRKGAKSKTQSAPKVKKLSKKDLKELEKKYAAVQAAEYGQEVVNRAGTVKTWGTEEVAGWLDSLSLGEYKENFIKHDVRGSELLILERRDLKELGISKVGHIKRILQSIKEMHTQERLAIYLRNPPSP
ncbi:diacylglycerol kinase delta-like isoform X2 [Ptychodera flava]|uniref:diacylglycerol kinase delta-like isoform X2 n=1 Tax=Ptychodera flava TaxID=63121 RepID=UPI003969F657